MKKILLAATALALFTTAANAQSIRIGTEGAYAPWNFINEAGELAGYEVDLANAICEYAGIECEIVQNDWESIIPNLLSGNYDVIMAGMSITDERLETINFTQDYFPPDPSLFVAAADAEFDFDDLEGARIAVQGNTIQAAYADENFAGANEILSFATPDQTVADLAAGNVDLILADGSFLQPVVENSGGAIVFVGPEILIGGGVGGGLRKEDTDLLATFDEAIDALKADGTVNELLAEWYGDEAPAY